MQKIELTNKQYRLLLQLVALGMDVLENTFFDDDEEEETDELALRDDALGLEEHLKLYYKKFDIKDVMETCMDEDNEEYLDYTGSFREEIQEIVNMAYHTKATEIASFQLGMRDFKATNGVEMLESVADAEAGVEMILPFTTKYLNEFVENGFERMYIKEDHSARIISFSSE